MTEIDLIIKQFILEAGKLYTLPELYQQLDEKIRSETSSIEEIGDLLITDAALSAKILKLANSPLYGFRAEITNMNRALSMIGLKEVKNLILMNTVAQNFNKDDKYTAIRMEDFWRRSIYIALIAKKIASRIKHSEPDRLFICGIMSRIGQLVSCLTRRKEVITIIHQCTNSPNESEFVVETNMLGFTYNEVSAQLLKHWKVPDDITIPIQELHQPLNFPENIDDSYCNDIYILHVATMFSHLFILDCKDALPQDSITEDLSHSAVYLNYVDNKINQALNINADTIDDILFEIEIDALEILSIVFPKSTLIF